MKNFQMKSKESIAVVLLLLTAIMPIFPGSPSLAAENLTLKKGISYVNDKDMGFPILADKLNDATIESGKPSFIFFGASGDMNTARQAKRLVNVYNKLAKKDIKFIIVNIDKPANQNAKTLIKKHYKGYIPCQVILNESGQETWNKIGEVSEREVVKQISKQLKK